MIVLGWRRLQYTTSRQLIKYIISFENTVGVWAHLFNAAEPIKKIHKGRGKGRVTLNFLALNAYNFSTEIDQ